VNKDVRLAIDCDESPTLFVVEPLDGSCSHCGPPYYFLTSGTPVLGGNHNGNLKGNDTWWDMARTRDFTAFV
jgi:hypothetical protein